MSRAFSSDLLPHDVDPSDTLYVTDRELNIVYANDEWVRFAGDNNGRKLLETGSKLNLLAGMSGRQRDRWEHIYHLLREGQLPHHHEQMNCSSPSERRIYRLRVTPKKDGAGDVAWFIHHNVRIDKEPEAVDRVARQLDALDRPEALAEEFHDRIVSRKVRIPHFDVARHFEPLEEIGGDLVWHREYPDGISDLIHADVMGHGAGAGLIAAKIAVVLDELASVDLSPGATVAALNRALLRMVPGDEVIFATGLCFRFEQNRQHVICCDFGHEEPIFSKSGPIELKGGYPVGLVEREGPRPEITIDLNEHGTRFLVFSDGITEQFNANGEMFGVARLVDAFRRGVDAPPDEMVHQIVQELRRFRGSQLVKDDQTLLVLEFTGDHAAARATG